MNKTLSEKKFFLMACTIALPIMVQNLISTLVNTADTIMLGYVSQEAMAASSLASNVHTIMWTAFYGFTTGAAVLGAQYWGKKDIPAIEQVLGLTIRFCTGVGILAFLVSFLAPEFIMSIFTSDAVLISEGAAYLRLVSFSFLFESFSTGYFAVLRSTEKVLLPSTTFVISLGINVFMNAVFIFGFFGMPKLGIAGVAMGTVSARAFEVIVCIFHSLFSKDLRFRIRYLFSGSGALLHDFLQLGLPACFNDIAWGLASSMFSVILGHMGSDTVAANAVAAMALNIGAIVSRGFANATTIIVGKVLGTGDLNTAKLYARRMVVITFVFSCLGGLVMLGIRPLLCSIYSDKLTQTALSYLGAMLAMQAYRIIGEGLNTCWICGCFRAGGDSKFGAIVDSLCMWLIAVPAMAAAAYIFKLPVLGVYFVMCLDEFEKMPFVISHYRKFTWLHNITREINT
jgi:putative MATE family efflux protein